MLFLALMASTGIQASRPEVRMADKIAMRSLVLSKNMPRIGGKFVKIIPSVPSIVICFLIVVLCWFRNVLFWNFGIKFTNILF